MITGLLREDGLSKSSLLKVFIQKDVLKICSKFAGEHSYRILISIKLQRGRTLLGPQLSVPCNFLRPPAQLTFSQPLTMELIFHVPLPQHKISKN